MTTKLRAASFQDGAVTTAKIAAAAITNAKIADGAVDSDAIGSSAIVANKLDIGQIGGRRNIVINGAMQVAQRGTSQSGITASANEGYTTVDRFAFDGGTHGGVFTASQSTDAPTGFSNSLKMDCTTADTSIAAGEYLMLQTRFEGQDVQQLKKGTSSAEKVTVSFYVKGNASATYMCELQDNDNARTNGQTFAVTTDWTRVILTFVGDTTGTLDNDNNLSLRLNFFFHSGSTFNGGTFTSNQWTGTTNERVGSITSFFDSTDREFFITGIQLEVGSQATPFEHRSFGEELALCKRYYQSRDGKQGNWGSSIAYSTSAAQQWLTFPEMRAAPTVTFTGTLRLENGDSTYNTSTTSFAGTSTSTQSASYWIGGFSGLIDNDAYYVYATPTTSQMKFDSEL